MLTIFPSLLAFEQLAPTLVRITLAIILIHWAYKGLSVDKKKLTPIKIVHTLEGIAGLMLFFGLWTQIGALIVIVDMIVKLYHKVTKKAFLTDGVNYYFLVLILALTLLVTGAGLFAMDLPL